MYSQEESVKKCINDTLKLVKMYEWLLDLYVLDFFVDNHWEKLPKSWRDNFFNLDPQELGKILSSKPTQHLFPLSFLALISTIQSLSIPRDNNFKPQNNDESIDTDSCKNHPRLKNLFLKHVKLKKET